MKMLFFCICLSTVFWGQNSQSATALRTVEKEASILLRRIPVRTIVPRVSLHDVWTTFTPCSVQVRHLSTAHIDGHRTKEEEFTNLKRLTNKIGTNCIPTLLKSEVDIIQSIGRTALNFKFVFDQFLIRVREEKEFSASRGSRVLYFEDFSSRRRDLLRNLRSNLDKIKDNFEKVDQKEKESVLGGITNILEYVKQTSMILDMGIDQVEALIHRAKEMGLYLDEEEIVGSPMEERA